MNQSSKKGGYARLYDVTEQMKADREQSTPVTPVTPVTTDTPVTPVTRVSPSPPDAAPTRDFARVANSVVRDAIPAGLFSGKGKQLYDFLYSQTRGAIVPARSARIPTDRVMKGAGMSRHTYRAHLERLMRVGLVKVEEKAGEHGGNIFTVYLPEEVDRGDRGHRGDRGEKLPGEQGSQVNRGDRGLSTDSSMTSTESKTLIKTNTEHDDDDAALAGLNAALKQAAEEVTGRELSPSERDRWRELGEVLATELKIAAARTTVSSAPSFLAEHLRRRLWKKDKRELQMEATTQVQTAKSSTLSPDQIKSCPDCGGTGFKYKGENFTGGVEKCRHEKLITNPKTT